MPVSACGEPVLEKGFRSNLILLGTANRLVVFPEKRKLFFTSTQQHYFWRSKRSVIFLATRVTLPNISWVQNDVDFFSYTTIAKLATIQDPTLFHTSTTIVMGDTAILWTPQWQEYCVRAASSTNIKWQSAHKIKFLQSKRYKCLGSQFTPIHDVVFE